MKKYAAIILACVFSSSSFADTLSLDLNDDALRLNYQHGLDKNYHTDFAWTHVKDLGDSLSAALTLTQSVNNDITAYIGGKALFQQHDHLPDGTAIAVGGAVRITPAANKNVALVASAYFAPDVLSFGDMENYQELEIRGEYKASEQLTAYVGYRNNTADYSANSIKVKNVDLYDGFMIGGQFKF
jgi:hypothetical protein